MPVFHLTTNVAKNNVPDDFLSKTTALMASTLGKPESYCVASVAPDSMVSFGGTTEPCGIAQLMSIGCLGVKENKKHAAAIYDHIEKALGIRKDKLYIHFINETSANVGYNGTTFHDILG